MADGGDALPVGLPPRGGPLGRSRGRLSASALTTYLRCPRQWLLLYQAGMQGPTRPSQILGVVLEEAFCELLMMHPPEEVEGVDGLRHWAIPLIVSLASNAHLAGERAWEESLWNVEDEAWSDLSLENLIARLQAGLDLFLVEVKACFDADGGPYLSSMRQGEQPFEVPAPCQSAPPSFPLPDKVPDAALRRWPMSESPVWQTQGSPVKWNEAWECARPWFKDPRVHQPQRLYHPEGWASGELDLVLRWDGRIRIVDIKSGRPGSAFASSLEHQLRFYAWLWHETHDGQHASGMEGWYLDGAARVSYDVPDADEINRLSSQYASIHQDMQTMVEGVLPFPVPPDLACDGSAAGCGWCSLSKDGNGEWHGSSSLSFVQEIPNVSLNSPYQPLSFIQGRVAVKGRLTGTWGPLPNHFGEPVLGAVLVVGEQHITIEESEPGAFPTLHSHHEQDVVLLDVLPGVWRDQPRLYLDERSSMIRDGENKLQPPEVNFTRLGLLRTRANVTGHVLSIGGRSGVRVDGKPWSMVSFILWDGASIAEVVAFGSSINQRLLDLRPGDEIRMTGVEIGWRSGVLQLRIDNRKTRIETSSKS
jgi:hypothetical protein